MDLGEAAASVHGSPDGQLLAVCRKDINDRGQPWEMWILDSASLKKKVVIPDWQVPGFQFTPDSKFIVAGQHLQNKPPDGFYRHVLDVFDVESGTIRKRHKNHVGPAGSYHYSGGRLLGLSSGGYLTYESPDQIVFQKDDPPFTEGVGAGNIFSPDGRHRLFLFSTDYPRGRPSFTLSLQDVANSRIQKIYHDPKVKATATAFSPNSNHFAVGTSGIRRFEPDEGPGPLLGKAYVFTIPD